MFKNKMFSDSIYFAGPDVFLPNAKELFAQRKQYLVERNFLGFSPLDLYSNNATEIVQYNEDLIRKCNIIIANLIPFRGSEPDSGTVYEIGFAKALKKRILVFNVPKIEYKAQVNKSQYQNREQGTCLQGWKIEDFGKRINIMLSENVEICSTFEDCVDKLINS